jgi:glycosyltransferase involved in cell wall biosynthesis
VYRERRIAVIIPAYQEARLVGRTLESVPPWVDDIIVVDDASTDGTHRAVSSQGDPRIVLLRHERNAGVGRTIVSGYRKALELGAEVLVVMAADGQMDPEDLPTLLDPVVEGHADYVKGNRLVHAARRQMPVERRVAGRLLGLATRLGTGLSVGDSQCGFTALGATAARALPLDELWPRYGYPNDLLGLLAAARLRVVEVPVRPVYADEESGVRPWHFGVVLWIVARRAYRSRRTESTQGRVVPLAR